MQHRLSVFCLALAGILSGCVSVEDVQNLEPVHLYGGPHRSPAELVMLSTVGQSGQVFVRGIDAVSRSAWSGTVANSPYVYLLPGKHDLKLQYSHGAPLVGQDYSDVVGSQQEMLAGHTYAVHFDLASDDKKVRFHVVDYGAAFPKKCIIIGVRDGGPTAPSTQKCVREAAPA